MSASTSDPHDQHDPHDHEASSHALGARYEASLEPALRRARGAHYTPPSVTEALVARALAPLVEAGACASADDVLALRVCDPSVGAGAFLVAAGAYLARALAARGLDEAEARRLVAARCLFGVDVDPGALELARGALEAFARGPLPRPFAALVHGDAVGPGGGAFATWFPEVFAAPRAGFDAIVGNPPWVSYAGRAAQPLAPDVRAHFEKSPAFAGYKNLQGVFVHESAKLLRPGGRLAFVLPTSTSDLAGYAPTRRAHDALCACDDELPDFERGGFEGVFQPCMGLLSTKRAHPIEPSAGAWPLARRDLEPWAEALRAKLAALPRLPPELFGERGFQSNRGDAADFADAPTARHTLALRAGSDVRAFERLAPSQHADPARLAGRARGESAWRAIDVLLRQTARVPVAARSDGGAFRNSVLAGFASGRWSADFLVAWLNSSPVRFAHWVTHRDARQGMPQLKIGHLRDLPAPLDDAREAFARLERLGAAFSARNTGIDDAEQRALDEASGDALGLDGHERERVRAWAATLNEASARPSGANAPRARRARRGA